jgi:hypothetical protein
MDFDKLDQQTFSASTTPETKTETVNNEDGSQFQRIVAPTSGIVEVGDSFVYNFTNIIIEKTVGTEPKIERFLETEGAKTASLPEFEIHKLFYALNLAGPWSQNSVPVFTTTIKELRESVTRFGDLCSRLEKEKEAQLSKNRGVTMPKFSFSELSAKIKKAHSELEAFLLESLTFQIRELVMSNETGDYSVFCFDPEQKVSSEIANSRLLSCELSFTTFPHTSFKTDDLFGLKRDGDVSGKVPLEDWFEIRFLKFKKSDILEGLNASDFSDLAGMEVIYIQRNMILGDYKKLRELLLDDTTRNIWNRFSSIKSTFLAEAKNTLTWEDFCAFYVRPPITVVEEKEWKPLSKDLKSLPEKLEEDKKIYAAKERAKIVANNKAAKDDTDSGFIEDIKRDLKGTKDLDGLYKVLSQSKLGALAKASFDCLDKVASFSKDETNPEIFDPFSSKIPEIKIPKFSFPETPAATGPSQNIAPLAVEQIKKMILEATLSQLDSFFTVEKCEDFSKFFDKKAWAALGEALKDALKKDWDKLVSTLSELLDPTNCFTAEELLSLVYKASDILPPSKVVAMLSGGPGGPSSYEMAELAYLVLGAVKIGTCGVPNASLIAFTSETIRFHLPDLVETLEAIIDDPPQDFVLESKIKCETSYESFMQWLLDNGLEQDKVQCLIETTKSEKSQFLRGLEEYIKNQGKAKSEDPFVIDSSTEATIKQMCISEFSSVFDAFSKNVVDYSIFVTAGTGAQFGATQDDYNFLDSMDPAMAQAAKEIAGMNPPDNLRPNTEFQESSPYDFVPFLEIVNDVFSIPEIHNQFFPDYFLFSRDTKLNYPQAKETYEFSYKDTSVSLEKFFGPLRGHKRVLKVKESSFEVSGVPFVEEEIDSPIVPVWSKKFADLATPFLVREQEPFLRDWRDSLSNSIINQIRNSFVDFLCEETRNSLAGQTVSFDSEAGPRNVYTAEAMAKYLSKIPYESCSNGSAVFGKDAFCSEIKDLVKAEMERRRAYQYDLVRPLGSVEIAPRVASLFFLLGSPFLSALFKDYETTDRVISNYVLWRFPELRAELEANSGFIPFNSDSVFTEDDLKRARDEDSEEIMDNSGDEYLKVQPVLANMDRISFASLKHLKNLTKTQQNFELISSGFANFMNSKNGWVQKWVNSLPVWQISRHVPNTSSSFGSFKHKVMFTLGIEYFSGTWKTVKISAGDAIFKNQPIFVDYGTGVLLTPAQIAEDDSIVKYRVSLNLNVMAETITGGVVLGSGNPFRLIARIVSSEFDKSGLNTEPGLFNKAREVLSGQEQLKKVLTEYLCFNELFELFNVFLFELTLDTTNFGRFLSEGLKFGPETTSSLEAQVQALNAVSSDTFGVLRSKFSISDIQKMALKMALKTPYLIFKSQVEMIDPVIRKARKIVDEAKLRGTNLDFAKVALVDLRPANLWLLLAKSPPITPLGMLYVALEKKNKSSEEFISSVDAGPGAETTSTQGERVIFGKMCVPKRETAPALERNVQEGPC